MTEREAAIRRLHRERATLTPEADIRDLLQILDATRATGELLRGRLEEAGADARLGSALRRCLRESSSHIAIERKVGDGYQITANGREWRGPFDVCPGLLEGMEAHAESADAYYSEHPPIILQQKDLPTIQDLQRIWAEARDAHFDPNSSDWRCRIHRQPQDGGGNLYTLDGRRWNTSQRCDACCEFGAFADTELCPDCEVRVPALAARLEGAK